MFELTVLVDNNTLIDKYFLGEPALSFYIEYDGKKILFDTGYSDVILKNAEKMGIKLEYLDYIVLSHGHNDHTGGLKYLIDFYKNLEHKPQLIASPNVFAQRFDDIDGEFGSPVPQNEIERVFDVQYTSKPLFLTPNINFLGKIPRINNYGGHDAIGLLKESNQPDFVDDDSALAIHVNNEIILVTGCSHSGIINICEYAKRVLGLKNFNSIIGGLHLQNVSQSQFLYTQTELNKLNLKSLYACHCTGLEAICKLAEEIKICEVGVGLKLVM